MWAASLCRSKYAWVTRGKLVAMRRPARSRRLTNVAILRHADRQLPIAHPQRQPADEIDAGFGNEVAAGDAHVDRAFGTQDRDVVGAEKRDFDRHIADAGKQAALLPAKLESGSDQQLGRHLGQPALARNANAKIVSHRKDAGCQGSGSQIQGSNVYSSND